MEDKAKKIIEKILYITIATANKNAMPWNSPVYSAYDQDYNFYWASDKNSQHSKNIAENPNVFLAIYDSTVAEGTGEGVYVEAKAHVLENEKEIEEGLSVLYGRINKTSPDPSEFLMDNPRRVYKAVPVKIWMNDSRQVNGKYIDIRTEIIL